MRRDALIAFARPQCTAVARGFRYQQQDETGIRDHAGPTVSCRGVTLRSSCDDGVFCLNPWNVHLIEAVVAGGDRLQEVVGDKAAPFK